ncbi:MAG TPA: hypothetical protein VEJ20_05105, partial [Candidatus Eremiobacteraceae bacterium]|nr:hypothetical protein [Candidatus Eremiobacteraceae bacterium]
MLGGSPFHLMWSSSLDPNRPKTSKKVDWRRILSYFAPYRREEALVLLCIVVASVIGLLPAYLSKLVIDVAIKNKDLHLLAELV